MALLLTFAIAVGLLNNTVVGDCLDLYGLTMDGHLVRIDGRTGAAESVLMIPYTNCEALEMNVDGTLLAIVDGNLFLRINPNGISPEETIEIIQRIDGYVSVEGLAFNSDHSTLFASAHGTIPAFADSLITIDPAEGATTFVGFFVTENDAEALALSPMGQLYGSTLSSTNLVEIDPNNGEASLIKHLEGQLIAGLDFSPLSGVLYGVTLTDFTGGPSHLVTIEPETGSVSSIGALGVDGVSALVVADCNDNGIPDGLDVDCNANGFPDDCDIAGERSADTNGNGVPDECDCLGDLDGDCDSDLGDFAIFQRLFSGP